MSQSEVKLDLKILSIKKSAEFKEIGKKGQKFYSKTLLLISAATPQIYFQNLEKHQNCADFCRVGYTVSKKVGNAVTRNKAKRRLREVFRSFKNMAKNHYDYVIIARKEIAGADFDKISSDLKFCLRNIHRVNSNNSSKK